MQIYSHHFSIFAFVDIDIKYLYSPVCAITALYRTKYKEHQTVPFFPGHLFSLSRFFRLCFSFFPATFFPVTFFPVTQLLPENNLALTALSLKLVQNDNFVTVSLNTGLFFLRGYHSQGHW